MIRLRFKSLLFKFLLSPVVLFVYSASAPAATVEYSNDFESGFGDISFKYECRDEQYNRVTNVSREGSYSLRTFQRGDQGCVQPNGVERKRTKFVLGDVRYSRDTTYWIGFSVYVPKDYPIHRNDGIFVYGSTSGSQPGEPAMYLRDGKWQIDNRWYDGSSVKHSRIFEGKADTGRWTDFVLELRRSPIKGNGVLRAWMDGKLVGETTGVIVGTDYSTPPVAKLGIYFGGNRSDDYTLNFDSIKIAQGSGAYAFVVPGNSDKILMPPTNLVVTNVVP
ncbi:hypothetical protein Nhal_3299 [Nitrosococcus halophilus Nc 4]|uniref:Polysaccharide lyase n=1 Tax=Nitrosococcus halophilus (strain Nc4) TaxID=472759 RepID=D5C0M0_NITHN|nr:polysaccharide lyase [Nitrosococcus halophilus]ADE16343.1 hypothetical protein Nhal_3299 [Nitrosococcus halophilus Nc 4]